MVAHRDSLNVRKESPVTEWVKAGVWLMRFITPEGLPSLWYPGLPHLPPAVCAARQSLWSTNVGSSPAGSQAAVSCLSTLQEGPQEARGRLSVIWCQAPARATGQWGVSDCRMQSSFRPPSLAMFPSTQEDRED